MKSLFTIVTISFLVIACSESPSDKHEQHTIETSSSNVTGSEIAGMTLNNGHKWQLDQHTRASLADMKAKVNVTSITSAKTEELKALGKDLTQQLDSLIQGCTMEGAEHDQLHLFLTAYIPAIKSLSSTGSVEAAQKIGHYLDNYTNYFE